MYYKRNMILVIVKMINLIVKNNYK